MAALDGNVKVPGLGSQSKKTVLIVSGGIVVIAGVVYYRHRNSSATVATTADQIDPATGYAYGSAEDAAALAQQASYQDAASYTGTDGGPSSTPAPAGAFTSNAQWSQAAAQQLETYGDDTRNVSAALGKYISGASVEKGSRDESLIRQAIAAEGLPPVPGRNGYPPSIRTVAAPPPPHPKPPKHPPHAKPQVEAPHVEYNRQNNTLRWGQRPNASHYEVHGIGNATTIETPSTFYHPGKSGTFHVRAVGKPGYKTSDWSNSVRVSIKK